jgi:hypothetical protein
MAGKKVYYLFFAICLVLSFSIVSASQLKVTSEHPFLLNGKWIPASDLKAGDILKTSDGKTVVIKNITEVKERVKVYNLEASPYNDFIVSDGLIVHNSNAVESSVQDYRLCAPPGCGVAETPSRALTVEEINTALRGSRVDISANPQDYTKSLKNFMDNLLGEPVFQGKSEATAEFLRLRSALGKVGDSYYDYPLTSKFGFEGGYITRGLGNRIVMDSSAPQVRRISVLSHELEHKVFNYEVFRTNKHLLPAGVSEVTPQNLNMVSEWAFSQNPFVDVWVDKSTGMLSTVKTGSCPVPVSMPLRAATEYNSYTKEARLMVDYLKLEPRAALRGVYVPQVPSRDSIDTYRLIQEFLRKLKAAGYKVDPHDVIGFHTGGRIPEGFARSGWGM